MSNPYSNEKKFVLANGEPIEALKFGDEQAFSSNGEINAYDKKDLINTIAKVISSYEKGEIKRAKKDASVIKERREILRAAYYNEGDWKVLGEVMAEEIQMSASRTGFVRKVMNEDELGQGDIVRIRMREKNVVAYIAVSTSEIEPVYVRDKYIYPPEFYINGRILIGEKDLKQSSADLLGEAYEDGLEAVMVREDRVWKQLADRASTVVNNVQIFAALTPTMFNNIKEQVTQWGLPTVTALMSNDLWNDITSNADFNNVFDPVTQYELLLNGEIGSLYGVTLITDAFRDPKLKVLEKGELYIVAPPEFHGTITTRGPVSANPIDNYSEGRAEKGWFLNEIVSLTIVNPKSVAKGVKI